MINNIVNYIITTSTQETTTGNYNVYFDEIAANVAGVTIEFVKAHFEEIKDEIDTRPEILSETWESIEGGEVVGFDINLCLDSCPNYCEEF